MNVTLFNIADYLYPYSHFLALSAGYLKSYFEKYSKYNNDIRVTVEYENILQELTRIKPKVIGMSVASEFYNEAIKLAVEIRKILPESILVLGGYHITTLPESFNKVFNFGVIGEGEITFLELIHAIYEKADEERFRAIRGLIFFDKESKLVRSAPRELIPNLDSIPQPYRGRNKGIYTNIITSRGCPFGCTFCSTTLFWKRTIRFNSAEFVMDEMLELIRSYKVRHITFWDDLFIGDVNRLRKILSLIKQEKNIFKSITFGVSARPNLIVKHPEILDIFKEMHVLRVSLGFESGSQRMLNMIKGENATVENNRKALNLLKRYPFFVNGGFIIGSPGEHLEDIKDTYSFVKNSGLHGGYAAIAIPYPGTQFWDYAKSENLVSNDMDFARLRTISNYTGLKEGDFIYLAKEININDFLDYGRRFQKYFSRQAALSYLDFGKLNLRILILFLHDPSAFLPDFRRIIAAFFKGIFAKK
jgi:magnesium-protoporphyrin IX monomethyl ester (oxidative) cyclase